MRKRLLLLVASAVAAGAMAAGLSLAGFGARSPATVVAAPNMALRFPHEPTPRIVQETVYVPAPAEPATVTVHRTVQASGGSEQEDEHDGEHDGVEGSDD